MATAKKQTGNTKARVLVAGLYGNPNDVVEIAADELDAAIASGQVDTTPEAVAYAKTLSE